MNLDTLFDVALHIAVIFLLVQIWQLSRRVNNLRDALHKIDAIVSEELDDTCEYVKSVEEKIERLEEKLPPQEL